MIWTEISILAAQEAVEAIANILHEAGAGGVVIEDPEVLFRDWERPYGEIYDLSPEDYPEYGVVRIKGYLPHSQSGDAGNLSDLSGQDDGGANGQALEALEEKLQAIQEAIGSLAAYQKGWADVEITLKEVQEEDWSTAWQPYYHPVHVSPRLTIAPVWENVTPRHPDDIVIQMDPGMAFGTGTHPTTLICLHLLEKHVKKGDKVVDVGCGTGILSIAAAKLGASEVLALDLDETAVERAVRNSRLNGVSDIVTVRQNNLLEAVENHHYDLVLANILADVICRMAEDAARVLKPGGRFIASGIIASREEAVRQTIHRAGMDIAERVREEDWIGFLAQKPEEYAERNRVSVCSEEDADFVKRR